MLVTLMLVFNRTLYHKRCLLLLLMLTQFSMYSCAFFCVFPVFFVYHCMIYFDFAVLLSDIVCVYLFVFM